MHYFSFKYINLPIRHKLLLWFLPLILITIAITGFISYNVASEQVFGKVKQNQDNLLKKNIDQFNMIDQDTDNFLNYLFLSTSVQDLLESTNPSQLLQQTYASLSKAMITRPTIDTLIIYNYDQVGADQSPLAINQTGITSARTFDFFQLSVLNDLNLRENGKSSWYLTNPNQSLLIGDKQKKLMKARVIKNIYSLKEEGMVVVGINEEYIRKRFLSIDDPDTQMYITNKDGFILTSSNSQVVGKKFQTIPSFKNFDLEKVENSSSQIISDKWIISHKHSNIDNLDFFVVQSKEKALYELKQIKTITFVVMVICFIFSAAISFLVASRLTKPLQKLYKSMLEVEKGDFSQRVKFRGNDEIGQLGQRYDQMVRQINTLISDVYQSKLQQRNAELKTLQAQIHPHFLYNTLNTICWTAQRKGQKEIADMTYALSKIFRLTLSDGKDFISIKEELELVKNYLFLQEMRFKPSFTYEIEVENQIQNKLIPKLLIQPFVENAVIHGLEPSNVGGFIQIRVGIHSNRLLIEVVDNGVGMDEKHVHTLNESLVTNQQTDFNRIQGTGYAIHNVKERLLHVFGVQAKILIHSVKGRGTRVAIHLPMENMEVQMYDQVINR
jgi:two-component system, sensor histidine kinase YesM